MTTNPRIWTPTNYPLLNVEQAQLFRLLDEHIRVLGKPSSRSESYIAYKKEPEMKGGFVRISPAKKPGLNIHLALISHTQIVDPKHLCEGEDRMRWSRASSLVKCMPEPDIDYIMDLIRQAYDYALINDRE